MRKVVDPCVPEDARASSGDGDGSPAQRPSSSASTSSEGERQWPVGVKPGPIEALGSDVYVVEALMAERRMYGKRQFLVRWHSRWRKVRGSSSRATTPYGKGPRSWEPCRGLSSSP